ncbi:flagellar assembly protein FliW [Rhodocyclus tenuis]|uniref:Flagellar assembly factor FliW n=2 Tax=Rhodocyclus TaxID=1064 RepID=A0A6L5JVP6_RHOTE|nr:flagellar assembly protein FliW [Rhodocyclus gracilis]MQY51111.1 flagellar biosynthesis protein FliW [Rhodocyclus gracilis]MRD72005.1 flagellar biosynthesis protein FliW [Rhodocyclus gracilis]NJA88821.1 flagellar assembly protein FliW [Rhodocyclus gracilis]
MEIDIERLGLKNVPVDPETVFHFPQGLAGFETFQRFKVFHEEGKPTIFWLQSLDDAAVMFPIVVPESLDVEYRISLSDEDVARLDLRADDETAVAVIVYRDEADQGRIAASTRSPIILNLRARKGIQKVLRELHSAVLVSGN